MMTFKEEVGCIILAGGIAEEHKWRNTGVKYKPLLEIGSRSLLQNVTTAVSEARIKKVAIVGPKVVLDLAPRHFLKCSEGNEIFNNLMIGASVLSTEFVLVAADMPFLTSGHITSIMLRIVQDRTIHNEYYQQKQSLLHLDFLHSVQRYNRHNQTLLASNQLST